jgi:hypothetical protein
MRFGVRSVMTPDGEVWRVGRRWSSRPLPRWRKTPAGRIAGEALSFPDVGGPDDLAGWLVGAVAAIVLAVVVVPLLLFGLELILLGFLVAAAILTRGLLGRPWSIQATLDALEPHSYVWQVGVWRRSSRVITEVDQALSEARDPQPAP